MRRRNRQEDMGRTENTALLVIDDIHNPKTENQYSAIKDFIKKHYVVILQCLILGSGLLTERQTMQNRLTELNQLVEKTGQITDIVENAVRSVGCAASAPEKIRHVFKNG